MDRRQYMKKIKIKLKNILIAISELRPISRKTMCNQTRMMLTIISGQRELSMMNRQELIVLATKMIKYHGIDGVPNKKVNNVPIKSTTSAPLDDRYNMFV